MKNKKTFKKVYFIISVAAAIIVAAVIFYLSAQTAEESSGTSGGLIEWIAKITGITFSQGVIRTLAHLAEYAGFGFLVSNAFFSYSLQAHPIISPIIAFIYAVSDEIHQLFVPGRAFQIIDLTVDFSGILIGTLVFLLLVKLITIRKRHAKN